MPKYAETIPLHNEFWWYNNFFWIWFLLPMIVNRMIYKQPYDVLTWKENPYVEPPKNLNIKQYKFVRGTCTDRILTIYTIIAIFYYIYDTSYIIYWYGIGMPVWLCALFYHHVWSLYCCFNALLLEHYPWFIMYPMSVHPLLILFPENDHLNFVYLLSLPFIVYSMTLHPWDKNWKLIGIHRGTILIIPALVVLWLKNCTNDLRY